MRVTEEQVKELIETDKSVSIFINSANVIVNNYLSGRGLPEDILKQIELYLSAHFVAVSIAGMLRAETVGSVKEEYEESDSAGFSNTRYGRQAVSFDTSGTLKNLGKQKAYIQFIYRDYG